MMHGLPRPDCPWLRPIDIGAVMNSAAPSEGPPGGTRREPTVLRMLLGAQLRRLREAADMSAEKAGYEIRASRSKISRMETRRVGLKLRDIEDLLTMYGVTDEKQRAKIIALAGRSRDIGGVAVMRAQLRRLAESARLSGVRLQVVPSARGGHADAGGSFSILRFEERDLPDVVYIEQLTSAVYLDQGADVEHYLEVADQLSGEALTPADTIRFIDQVARET